MFLVFFRYYAKSPRETAVLQVTAGSFHPDLLMDKHPIIIEDRVYDVKQLAKTVLRYYYLRMRVHESIKLSPGSSPICTFANATFITPLKRRNKGDRHVIRARNKRLKDFSPIDFRLHTSQVLVLPPHWEFLCTEEKGVTVRVVETYDLLHMFMYPVGWSGALYCNKKQPQQVSKNEK